MLELLHALRLHRRHPGFAVTAVATLGLGIGAAIAVFSLVRAVVLRELPFAEPDRLVWMYNARTERDRAPFSIPDLADYARANRTLAGLAVFTNWTANLTGAGDAERLEGTRVGGEFFALLGARPLLGRTLDAGDATASARIAVLTHGLWTRRFGADPAVVGTTIVLNGAGYTIAGVLPPGFVFPFRDAEVAVPLPLRDDPRRTDRGANFLRVVARLKPGVTIAQAKGDLDAIARRLQRAFPADDARKTGVNLYPLHAEIVSDYRVILWTLLAAVVVLVGVGCGNLANLLLLRVSGRAGELAIRASLGASPLRIAWQLLAEAAVIAIAGGALGLVVAGAAIALWARVEPADFPRLGDVRIDGSVAAFAAAVAIAVTLVCGLAPAWIALRRLADAAHAGGRAATPSRRGGAVRRMFVVVQVAGAAVLLVAMGLVSRALDRLEQVDPGFTTRHAVAVQLSLPPTRYATPAAVIALYDALRDRLDRDAGVRAAGAVSLMPLSGMLSAIDLAFPDRPAPPPDAVPQAHFRIASAGYFAAAGIRLVEGREFSEHDDLRAARVAVVSRTFAERHWPGERAVGGHVQIALGPSPTLLEVVGVVSDVKQFTVDGAATADLYIPLEQIPPSQAAALAARMYWIVRTDGDPASLVAPVRAAVRAVDPDVAASSVRTLDDVLAGALGGRRASVRLLEIFGQTAIALVGVGVYAIAGFAAAARRREMAIRAAFGASDRELVALIVRSEYRALGVGIGGGLTIAWIVSRALGPLLSGVSRSDPGTYVAVGLLLTGLTFVAAWAPVMRAGRIDPAEVLRA